MLNKLRKAKFYHFFQSVNADAKLGYDNVSYCAIHITASKFLDKECEYKVLCDLLNSVISNDPEWQPTFEGQGRRMT